MMNRKAAVVAMLAAFTVGATGPLAQAGTSVTTNSYSAASTSEDIRASCKEVSVDSQATLSAKCNKEDNNGRVSAVSTTIYMPNHVGCQASGRGYRVKWGAASANITLVDPLVLLTSTGSSYIFGGYCDANGEKMGPSGEDIGDTTDGLKNDSGSLAKR